MICPNCKNEVGEVSFCTKCGTNLINSNTTDNNMMQSSIMPNNISGTTRVIIKQDKRFVGSIIPFPVFINDNKLGDLKNGETLTCDLGVGNYKVVFNMFEKNISQEINITGKNSCVEIICIAKFGFLTAIPKIKSVTYK